MAKKILYYVGGLIALTWIIIWHAACNTAGAEIMIDYVETRYPRFLKASMNAMKGDDD